MHERPNSVRDLAEGAVDDAEIDENRDAEDIPCSARGKIRLSTPTVEHMKVFARRRGADRKLSEALIEAIRQVLVRSGARGYLPDLRDVIRMLDRAE
jgi:hypothetical protein